MKIISQKHQSHNVAVCGYLSTKVFLVKSVFLWNIFLFNHALQFCYPPAEDDWGYCNGLCPFTTLLSEHNSKAIERILLKLHKKIKGNERKSSKQEP